jgi:putative transposase
MAAILGYDRPDQYTVAAAIREAILVTEEKPFGGVPDIILVDNGKELLSHHIQLLTQELHIILRACIRHQPQQKGKAERYFGTLNTRLWSSLPGYVDSNTEKRNPHAKADLTMAQLDAKLHTFIENYHHEAHSQLRNNCTPLQYWMENSYAEEVDVRKLDVLLMKAATRRVINKGIKYENRLYWHTALGDLVGKQVLIRRAPTYAPPDEIEVYYRDTWICTAFAIDSPTGKAITAREVRFAQQEQRQQARHRIQAAQEAVTDADAEIAVLEQQYQAHTPSAPETSPEATQADIEASPPASTQHKKTKRPEQHAPNLLDLLEDHYTTQE